MQVRGRLQLARRDDCKLDEFDEDSEDGSQDGGQKYIEVGDEGEIIGAENCGSETEESSKENESGEFSEEYETDEFDEDGDEKDNLAEEVDVEKDDLAEEEEESDDVQDKGSDVKKMKKM